MKNFLVLTLLFLFSVVQAQKIELISRYSYYTHETEGKLLVFGSEASLVEWVKLGEKSLRRTNQTKEFQEFVWELGSLPQGTNTVTFQVGIQDGHQVTQNIEVTRLASKANEVKIDRITGGLLVDNTPFFPFGFYASFPVGDIAKQEVYNAMNLMGVYQKNDKETLVERKAYMDECARIGIKVNYGLNDLVGSGFNRPDQKVSAEEEAQRWEILRKEVETFRDHPALLSWYMNDEPDGQSRPPELLEKAYQIIRQADPYHPVTVVFVIPSMANQFANSHDIAMTDPYPIPGDVNAIREYMTPLNQYFRFKKPLWLVPQAFGGGEFWLREPTADEIRVMTYLGLIENAMGVQYFIRQYPNIRPQSRTTWHGAVAVAHETAMLYPWLFSPKERIPIATNISNVSGKAFDDGHSLLILLANIQNRPEQIQFDLPPHPNGSKPIAIHLPFENRSIPVGEGKIQDMITGYGTKAYRIDYEKPVADDKNLFVNPGFEQFYSPAAPFGLYLSTNDRPSYNGATIFLTAETAHSGRYSLRFRNPTDELNQKATFFRMMSQKDRSYLVRFFAKSKTTTGKTRLKVHFEELDWEETVEPTTDWQLFSFWVPVNRSISSIQLGFEVMGAGTVWIDDVFVAQEPSFEVKIQPDKTAVLSISANSPDVEVRVSHIPTAQDRDFSPYQQPLKTNTYTTYSIGLFKNGKRIQTIPVEIPLSFSTFGQIRFDSPYSAKYAGKGPVTLVDGQFAPLDFKDKGWLGFDGKDVTFTLTLEKPTLVSRASLHYMVSVSDGIHTPLALEVETSLDGATFKPLGKILNPNSSRHAPAYYETLAVEGSKRKARFIRFVAKSPKTIGADFLFAGTNAWIFIDEVMVF